MGEARRSYLLLLLLLLLLLVLVVVGAASSSSDDGGRLRSRRDFRLPLVLGDDEADAGPPLPNSETAQSSSNSSSDSHSEEGKKKKRNKGKGGDDDAAAAAAAAAGLEPLELFEVARPVDVPAEGATRCSVVLLERSFGYTYGLPPAEAAYRPPAAADCGGGKQWAKVVLKWRGTCRGRQFDRISMVWLNGVELLRTCTAEPVAQGVVWEVEKDVTRYSALFREPGKVVVSLANVVDATYTGVFNITLQALFYPSTSASAAGGNHTHTHTRRRSAAAAAAAALQGSQSESADPEAAAAGDDDGGTGFSGPPDAVLPVTHMPDELQEGGYIQRIENASHTVSVTVSGIPRNVYRAVLEVCVSFHERDEFWYTNAPDAWVAANNLTGVAPGNGPFREVVARLDGTTVGAVWPFAVIYTGGLNPYLWRPSAAIGAFNLPSYDIDITSFVGSIVDGRSHTVSFAVTNALNVWFVQGNLHLWLDAGSRQTSGQLDAHSAPGYSQKLDTHGYDGGPDGDFTTSAARQISYSGTVVSSHGKLMWSADYHYGFHNRMSFADHADTQKIHQDANASSSVVVKTESRDLVSWQHALAFPLRLNYREVQRADKSVHITLNLTHRFDEDGALILPGGSGGASPGAGSRFSSLRNNQTVGGVLVIFPNNTNTGAAEAEQRYRYESSEGCYLRHVRARNYSVVADHVDAQCKKSSALQQQQLVTS